MKLFKWNIGRQNTGYKTLPFFMSKRFDLYLIKYGPGTEIPDHIDSIEGRNHFRLNIILWNAATGGEFICENPIFESPRIKIFRPDISKHRVTRINSGIRLVLSIGVSTLKV